MQDGIGNPLFFQFLHCQSGKEFLFPLKVSFEGGNQQTFTKAAGTAEEVITSGFYKIVDYLRFVYIVVAIFSETFKVLDTDWIKFAHNLCFYNRNKNKDTKNFLSQKIIE